MNDNFKFINVCVFLTEWIAQKGKVDYKTFAENLMKSPKIHFLKLFTRFLKRKIAQNVHLKNIKKLENMIHLLLFSNWKYPLNKH